MKRVHISNNENSVEDLLTLDYDQSNRLNINKGRIILIKNALGFFLSVKYISC